MSLRYLMMVLMLFTANAAAEPLFLECSVQGKSFDHKFDETVQIKIDQGTIDIASEEFPMFGPVDVTDTMYKATKRFTSNKGVKYFFSVEIDRVSGKFSAYETAAFPDRKIFNTTGSGPCVRVNSLNFKTTKPDRQKAPVKVIIRTP